jgi:hypothetical protein
MSKQIEVDNLVVTNISSDTNITLMNDLILQGNIMFNTTPNDGDVLTYTGGAWQSSTPIASSTPTTETINMTGDNLTPNVDVSFINTNGTATIPVSSLIDGFSKKIVKTIAPIPSTPKQWNPIDATFPNGQVNAIAFAPSGTHGPWSAGDLVIGGSFTNLGPNNANYLAYYDGSDWQPIADPPNTTPSDRVVRSLAFSDAPLFSYNGAAGQLWIATTPNQSLRGLVYRWTGPSGSFGTPINSWQGMGLDISADMGNLTLLFDDFGGHVEQIRFQSGAVWIAGSFHITFNSGSSVSEQVRSAAAMIGKPRFTGIVEGASYSVSSGIPAYALAFTTSLGTYAAGDIYVSTSSILNVDTYKIGRIDSSGAWQPLSDTIGGETHNPVGTVYAAVEWTSNRAVYGGNFTTRGTFGPPVSLPHLGIYNHFSGIWTTPWSGDGVPGNTVQYVTFHPVFTNHLWIVGKFTGLGTNNCTGIAFVDLVGAQFPINVWQRPESLNQPSISGFADFTHYSLAYDSGDSNRPYFGGAFVNLGPNVADYVAKLDDAIPGQPDVVVSLNGGGDQVTLTNIGDSQELIYNSTLGEWLIINNV